MEVLLHPDLRGDLLAMDAANAVEACVHCGFCLATCPTYLDSRDERDSPRGRIYLVKELLETNETSEVAQHHLDRCLTCRSCETTCPSGVAYGDIADAGRSLMEQRVTRSPLQRLQRWLLRRVVAKPALFTPLLRLGQFFRPVVPRSLREHIPAVPPGDRSRLITAGPTATQAVIFLEGCVQRAATPTTNRALRNILRRLGIGIIETPRQGCCGALNTHLAAVDDGLDDMRRNIDAWWPAVDQGATAIISSATGCGVQLADYGKALQRDPVYAEKAARISELATEVSAFLEKQPLARLAAPTAALPRVAVQIPCSQYHGLGSSTGAAGILRDLGYPLAATRDDHLCCGSAGSYSILQPAMSDRLRQRKLAALTEDRPELIVSGNVGCQLHLTAASAVPVKHWLELVDERLT